MRISSIHGLFCAGLLVLMAACSDQTGPQVNDDVMFARGGRLATLDGSTSDSMEGGTLDLGTSTCLSEQNQSDLPPCMLRHLPDAPPLETYDTTFTAVQGQPTYFVVHYLQSAEGGSTTKSPFMTLTIPKAAKFVAGDGTKLKQGDSVEVSVKLDQDVFHVEFGPHGSTMRPAATLWFSLKYADTRGLDLDGATVFYRPQEDDPWASLNTEFYPVGGYLVTLIYHFSGYAVAW